MGVRAKSGKEGRPRFPVASRIISHHQCEFWVVLPRRKEKAGEPKGPSSSWHQGDLSGALRRPLFSRALLSLKEAGLQQAYLDESGNTGTHCILHGHE